MLNRVFSGAVWADTSTSLTLFFPPLPSSWRCAAGVLLRAMWEVQRHGYGASGPESGGPLWPVWSDLFTEDGLNDSHSAGEFRAQTHQGSVIERPFFCTFGHRLVFWSTSFIITPYLVAPFINPTSVVSVCAFSGLMWSLVFLCLTELLEAFNKHALMLTACTFKSQHDGLLHGRCWAAFLTTNWCL